MPREDNGRVAAGAVQHDGQVLFWVKDTGEGISADELPRVFERFWQRRKQDGGGAGLGLPIVKGLIEAHGGRVWVESSPGAGSTFYFTVPVAPAVEGKAAPTALALRDGQRAPRLRERQRN